MNKIKLWQNKSITPRKTVIFIINNYKKIKTEFHENTLIYFLKIYLRDNNFHSINLFHHEKLIKNNYLPLYKFFKDKNEKIIEFHVIPKDAKYPTNSNIKKENENLNNTSQINNNTNPSTDNIKNNKSKPANKKSKSVDTKKIKLKNNSTSVQSNPKIIKENNNTNQTERLKNINHKINGTDIQKNIEIKNKELEDLCKQHEEEISTLKKEITEAKLKISDLENNNTILTKNLSIKNLPLNISNSNLEIISKNTNQNNSYRKLEVRSSSVISFNILRTFLEKKPSNEPKNLTPCPTKDSYFTNLVPLIKSNNSMENISISPYQSNNNTKREKKENKIVTELIPKENLLEKNGLHFPLNYIKYSFSFNYLSKDELLFFSTINKKEGVCFCYYLLNILNDKINNIIDQQNNLSSKYNTLLDTNNNLRSSILLSHISKSGLRMLGNPKFLDVYENSDLDYFINEKIVLFIYRILFQLYNKFGDNMTIAPRVFMTMVIDEIKNGSTNFENYGKYLYDLIDYKVNFEIENIIKVKEMMEKFEIKGIEGTVLSKIDKTTAYVGYIVKDMMNFCGLFKNTRSKDQVKDNEKIEIINEYGNIRAMKEKYMNVFNKMIEIVSKYYGKE